MEEVKPNTFEEAIEDVADDSLKVFKSTSDVIDILQQMSSEAAKEASQIAVDFVQDINIGKKFLSLYQIRNSLYCLFNLYRNGIQPN